ncbi:MAG: T9SS type A sorting domain-containing protein, partial [Bacteroidota bacterium]
IAAIDTSIYNFETRKKVATIKEKNIVLNKFSPDGEILAAVTSNNGISLWNSQTGEFLKRLSFTISASVIEFSKDRKTLATGDSLGNISIWDVQSGILQTGFKNGSGIVNGLCFQNNYILAGSNDSTVKKWNLNSGILEDTLRFPYKVTSIALHPDDTKIAVGLDDGTIILTSFPVGEFTVLTKFKGLVSSLLITEDNQTITTLKRDYSPSAHSIQIRSIETGEISDSIVFKGNNSVVVAPNNKIVAILTDSVTKFVQLADTNNQNILLSRFTNSPAYTQFAFSPDSRTLVSADQDTLINIWNISTGLLKAQLRRSNKGADYIGSFSPDGSLFLTADNVNYQERASAIWNTSDYSRRLKIPTFGLNGKISSNNSRAVFKNKNSVIIWDVQKNELLDSITLDATIEVADYNFSPNSQYLIIAQKNLYVWDIAARKVSAILDEPQAEEQYRYLAFSPNGRYLVTAGSILRLWDLNGITSIENETPVLKTTELLKVFPNPSNGILTLQLDSFKNIPDGEIRIYNSLGMLLKTVPAEFLKEMKIDCSELSGGVYFVELSSEKGVIARTSFIIAQ